MSDPVEKPRRISAGRLVLRQLEKEDYPEMAALLRSAEVAETYMLPEFENETQVRSLFDRLAALSADKNRFVWGIALDGRIIGILNDVDISGSEIEVGYAFRPEFWGKGYATEALGAAIQALFSMGYTAVKAGAFSFNGASMRVMEKCGMVKALPEETVEYRGKQIPCVNYIIGK